MLGYAMIDREWIRWALFGDASGSTRRSAVSHGCLVITQRFWYWGRLLPAYLDTYGFARRPLSVDSRKAI